MVPVPDTPMESVAFDALDITVTLPLALPAVVGAKVALKLALCPAARVMGALMPFKVNPVPLIVIWETAMLAAPEFVTVPESVWLFPTVTLPKLSVAGLELRAPTETCLPLLAVLTPWQPTRSARDERNSATATALNAFFEVVVLAADFIIVSQETGTFGSTD